MREFTLTRGDYSALVRQLEANVTPAFSPLSVTFVSRVVVWAVVCYGFYSFFRAQELCSVADRYLSNLAICAVIAFGIGLAADVWKAKRIESRFIADNGWFLAPQSMRLDEKGIEHRSRLGHAHLDWQAFMKHAEDAERFFLFVEPGQGLVVPKRVLQDESLQQLIRTKVPG